MERFTFPKLMHRIAEIGQMEYRRRLSLDGVEWLDGWLEGPEHASQAAWRPISQPHHWGGRDVKVTARVRFTVPEDWAGERPSLRVDLAEGLDVSGPDALAFLDGQARQGVDVYHKEILLPEDLGPGEHELLIEAYSGTKPTLHRFAGVELVVVDGDVRGLYYDAKVAMDAAKLLAEESYDRVQIVRAVEKAVLRLDYHEPLGDAFRASAREARQVLADELYGREWLGERPEVVGVGHAHIDVAWLWTLEHTRKKTARTFLTALRLMEQYPEYRFLQSQPQVYQFFREDFPEEYEAVRERIAEGRWEATGAMWLEADLNITGGEALIRQILYGKRFLREEFGIESQLLWLPDVFGYTWSLPQIMARAGVPYFMTTKISWNEFNRLPYDTFRWQGIDGTQVLAHFITTPSASWFATYNGHLTAAEVKGTWDAYKQKALSPTLLHAFGFGDGGGGPTADMLETARRLRDLPGMPRYRIGRADEFYRDLEAIRDTAPVWNGELYLEFHRGTYTSQALTKKLNRRSEQRLQEAEALASVAVLAGDTYPREQLADGWRTVLLNQFHDILPGSSIGEVYVENHEQLRGVGSAAEAAAAEATGAIRDQLDLPERSLVLVNPIGQARSGVATVPAPEGGVPALVDENGCAVAAQVAHDGQLLVAAQGVPAFGWKALHMGEGTGVADAEALSAETDLLEGPFLRAEFDRCGRLTSLWDKTRGREVLAEGELGNAFWLFEDKPTNNDAWNIDIYFEEKAWPLDATAEVRVLERGPVRAGLEFRHRFLSSTLVQRVFVYANLPRMDFETEVEWHEHHLLLKVAFPVAVLSTRASYEIQFGTIERPTHRNTSWDYARFEVPAQRWADLSEGDYGVSLLNDCKYGYDVHNHVMRLSLIKSATSPDPEADQGHHAFTYSIYPHEGDWRTGTLPQATDLNQPLGGAWCEAQGGAWPGTWSLVNSDSPNLVVSGVKLAEDDDQLVVRVYEAHGSRGVGQLTFGRGLASAVECNLVEEDEMPVRVDGASLSFEYRPYEIRTFKVRLR